MMETERVSDIIQAGGFWQYHLQWDKVPSAKTKLLLWNYTGFADISSSLNPTITDLIGQNNDEIVLNDFFRDINKPTNGELVAFSERFPTIPKPPYKVKSW